MTDEEKTLFHYRLEKELAKRIRESTPGVRKEVTLAAYKELYERVPWHISRNKTPAELDSEGRYYAVFLRPLLPPHAKVLELGCGSGSTLNHIGGFIREGIGIDATLTKAQVMRYPHISLREDDVRSITLKEKNFDLIYSFHLIEHLHPDDLPVHLQSVFDHLRSGGVHLVITPNAVTGPHDISRGFDDTASGFHLKEYTYAELLPALRRAGFRNIRTQMLPRALFSMHPLLHRLGMRSARVGTLAEGVVRILPSKGFRRTLGTLMRMNTIVVYARKP
jgi:SAM-dependent methyltransferase